MEDPDPRFASETTHARPMIIPVSSPNEDATGRVMGFVIDPMQHRDLLSSLPRLGCGHTNSEGTNCVDFEVHLW